MMHICRKRLIYKCHLYGIVLVSFMIAIASLADAMTGESLIDYNTSTNRFGAGLILSNWL